MAACLLSGCIGDLPEEQFSCLITADLYDKYNEAYVFSPQGEQKRLAMEKSLQAERECISGKMSVDAITADDPAQDASAPVEPRG
jgi:hypothetical protein